MDTQLAATSIPFNAETTELLSHVVSHISRRAQYIALREVLTQFDNYLAAGCSGEFDIGDVRMVVGDAAQRLGVPDPGPAGGE